MNQGRHSHGSCSLGGTVYVFGGLMQGDFNPDSISFGAAKNVRSIEALRFGSNDN